MGGAALCERWIDAGCTAIVRCQVDDLTFEECVEGGRDCSQATDADREQVEKCEEQLPEADCEDFLYVFAGFCDGAFGE